MAKFMGNPAGDHALACEWVGTSLAKWLGIPTFEFALIPYQTDFRILLDKDSYAQIGPAFITRWEDKGGAWRGDPAQLEKIENSDDLTKIVYLDTWLLNRDRWSRWEHVEPVDHYENVFIGQSKEEPGKFYVKAIDHSHVITYGGYIRERITRKESLECTQICGNFDEFSCYLKSEVSEQAAKKIGSIPPKIIDEILAQIPKEWGVGENEKEWLRTFITHRSKFVSKFLHNELFPNAGRKRFPLFGE